MNSQPKISIITITYNSEKYVEEALQSVIGQNYPNLEYIIIDGGSRDSTLQIIERYREHIAVLISEPDHGISDAFNKGIAHATGDVIGIINSDDYLTPGALADIAKAYDPSVDVYRSRIYLMNDSGQKFIEQPSMQFPLMPLTIHVSHQGTFVARQAYEKYGVFSTDFHYCMDRDLLRRFYCHGANFKYVPAITAVYRMGGTTATPIIRKRKEYVRLIERNGGTRWQGYCYFAYLWMFDLGKKMVGLFGEDFKRSLRYHKAK